MQFRTVAKAVFFIKDDPEAGEYQSQVIEAGGQLWFVANWFQEIATGKKVPGHVIPMARLPHVTQEDGLVRLGTLIPKELALPEPPPELLHAFGAVDARVIFLSQGPSSIH